MNDIKKQIKDFNLITELIGDENILLQRDSGTTFRTQLVNLPFTNEINHLSSTSGYLEHKLNHLTYQTVENTGTPNIKRPKLNFGSQFITVDNSGNNSTDIGIESVHWNLISNTPNTLEGYGILDGNSTSGGVEIIPMSYDELSALHGTNALKTGAYYIIIDYRTCYDQPDYNYNGNPISNSLTYKQSPIEPIMIFATSNKSFSPDAFQPTYPLDKIKYDITFNETEITNSKSYGRITERIDEYNNRTDYDHRTILFKRYRSYFHNLGSPLSGTINLSGNTVTGSNTNFTSGLSIGSIIYTDGYDFEVTGITSDTSMTITGNNLLNNSNLNYYMAFPQVDGASSNIPYTHTQMSGVSGEATSGDFLMNGHISDGTPDFGTNSQYFTNLYPGLFTLVAHNISIDQFSIEGGLNGGSNIKDYTYSTSFNGVDYSIFVKCVGGSSNPSVNHIIITNVGGTNSIAHLVNTVENNDFQSLSGLLPNRVTSIYYLLISKPNGVEMSGYEIDSVVNKYLRLIDPASIIITLESLNDSYAEITSLVNPIYYFNDTGNNEINNGGDNMFDAGNYIYTDLGQEWKCYEWKQNNIINDEVYREFETFQIKNELIQNNKVTSIDNYIGDNSNFYFTVLSHSSFMLANNVFGMYSYSNIIGDRSYNNGIYNWFNKNTISSSFQENTIRHGFYSNKIGTYCNNNIFNSYIYNNVIGDNFYTNNIDNQFYENDIKVDFYQNFITGAMYYNTIENECYQNYIYEDFYNNLIKNYFNGNILRSSMYGNIIADQFQNNTIGNLITSFDFYDNIINNRFKANLIQGVFQSNQIGTDFYSNTINGYFFYNKIDNFTIFNNFGNYTVSNNIGNGFGSNTVGDNFQYNILNDNFIGNTIGNYFQYNTTINNFQNNTINSSFQMNNIQASIESINFTEATLVYGVYNCTIILANNSSLYLNYFDGTTNWFVGITS